LGPTSGLDLHGEDEAGVLRRLSRQEHLRCWARAQVPPHFGLRAHRRAPDIVCLAEEGYAMGENRLRPGSLGQHGFDPADPQMHGLLLVSGHRAIPKQVGSVHQLDVYPLLCALLGVEAEAHDGGDSLIKALALEPHRRSR
jgi:predicted AlkP superfamily pyrophosphatase or phosphodiesterase